MMPALPIRLAAAAAAAGAALTGATTVLAAGPVSPAATPAPTLAQIKEKAADAISARLTRLTDLATEVDRTSAVTASDRGALDHLFATDEQGLSALGATIAADTTAPQAWQDAQKIVTAYRVYVLVVPQAEIVRGADTVGSAATTMAATESALARAIAGADLSEGRRQAATEALNDYTVQVDNAQGAVSGISAEVLGLTPAGYPANRSTLQHDTDTVRDARKDLSSARHDAEVIRGIVG